MSEVTTLGHESWDDPVEGRALEGEWLALHAHALLSGAEGTEVLTGSGGVLVEVHDDTAGVFLADCDVEVDLSVCHFCGCGAAETRFQLIYKIHLYH